MTIHRLLNIVVLAIGCVHDTHAQPSVDIERASKLEPRFVGLLQSASQTPLFAITLMADAGRATQGWRKLGEEIQGYRLVAYDEATGTLTLRDNLEKEYKLVLPEGRVSSNRLSDEEFERLRAQLESPNREPTVPLMRETARQFWLRMIDTVTPPVFSPDIFIDTQGTTLSEKDKKEFLWWQEFKKTEQSFVVAYRVDGMTDLMEGPRNPFKLPDHMTRNLLPQDWQELGLLSAIAKVKAEAMLRHRPQKSPTRR